MTEIIEKEGKLYGYGYIGGKATPVGEDSMELRWLNACTDVRVHNRQAQHLRIEQKQKDKARVRRAHRKTLMRFIAWQATGSVLSALLLCVALFALRTVGWLSAVIPATLALFIQQEVGRRSL